MKKEQKPLEKISSLEEARKKKEKQKDQEALNKILAYAKTLKW
jgi:hypothetical protein